LVAGLKRTPEITIRGVVGQIKWSYYVAAGINGYRVIVNRKTGTGTLRGTVVVSDAFKMAQRPLEFVALHKGGEWRWAITSHQITNGTVTATLAPLKEMV
jgi:hypothetical protein